MNFLPRIARKVVHQGRVTLTIRRSVHPDYPTISSRSAFLPSERPRFLRRPDGTELAYRIRTGYNVDLPGVMYLPGFQSNMLGTKAQALDEYSRTNDVSYVRFDYRGCGESTGDKRVATYTEWKNDALAVLDQLTAGPQVLIGNSLGATLALQMAALRPSRIRSIICLAISPNFPESSFESDQPELLEQLERDGEAVFISDHHTYVLTKAFVDDARQNGLGPHIPVNCPVRLLHGMQDTVVPYQASVDLAKRMATADVNVLCRKMADHRFSQPEDVQLLFEVLNCMVHGTDKVRDLAIRSWSPYTIYSRAHITQNPQIQYEDTQAM